MLLAVAVGGCGEQKRSLVRCNYPAQGLTERHYLLRNQRGKALLALSPAVPVASLFGESACFLLHSSRA